jgi:hypothetical protein
VEQLPAELHGSGWAVQAVHGTLDGRTLRTVLDARNYILALSEARQLRAQWQRACEMLFEDADVAALSKQVELALFHDAKLVLI